MIWCMCQPFQSMCSMYKQLLNILCLKLCVQGFDLKITQFSYYHSSSFTTLSLNINSIFDIPSWERDLIVVNIHFHNVEVDEHFITKKNCVHLHTNFSKPNVSKSILLCFEHKVYSRMLMVWAWWCVPVW
jgi:hypothetical protein